MISIEIRGLAEVRHRLRADRFRGAVRRALSRAGDASTTEAKRAVAGQLGLPQAQVAERLRGRMAGGLTYEIAASDQHFPLSAFGARQTRKGVSAAPWGTRRVFPGTFFAYGRSGVFRREGTARGPLEALYGGSVFREMERDDVPGRVRDVAIETMRRRIAHELGRLSA